MHGEFPRRAFFPPLPLPSPSSSRLTTWQRRQHKLDFVQLHGTNALRELRVACVLRQAVRQRTQLLPGVRRCGKSVGPAKVWTRKVLDQERRAGKSVGPAKVWGREVSGMEGVGLKRLTLGRFRLT
eukprot:356150-Chlamydomonas_euryale.AAC.1